MMMQIPRIYFYNLSDAQKNGLHAVCQKLKILPVPVSSTHYNQPLGALVGLEQLQPLPDCTEQLPAPMLLMVAFSQELLDRFLNQMRADGVTPIAYKAVLTPHNLHWSSLMLFQQLQQEHQAMQKGRNAHPT